jgi:fatty acid desaturase
MTEPFVGRLETRTGGVDKDGGDQGNDPIKRRFVPESWGRYPYGITIKGLRASRASIPLAKAIGTHLSTLALLSGIAMLFRYESMTLGILAGFASAGALALTYRGLECLVHGASHSDISENGKTNDLLADGLIALPVLQTVGSFRPNHLHHSSFAYEHDPCRIRMTQHPDVQRGKLPTLIETLKGLPREIRGFYRTAGASRLTLILGMLWHLAVLIAPTAFIVGDIVAAATAWALIHFVTFFITLPAVRAVAEAGEHDYARLDRAPTSMVERTFDNIGLLNSLIHPYGDKWHIEHHLFPGVPQYRLREVHRRLMERGFGSWMWHRVTLLGQPRPFSDAAPTSNTVAKVSQSESDRQASASVGKAG